MYSGTRFIFESVGKEVCIDGNDVAFFYPSIADDGSHFLTTKSGRTFRAKNVREIVAKGRTSFSSLTNA
jgi:hypothetical protein